MPNPLRILFLAANPAHTSRLQLDEEQRAISSAIQHGSERSSIEFVTEWGIRTSDLQRVILQHQPQVLHFSGHGSTAPGLMMGNEHGDATVLEDEAVAAIIRAAAPPVRMVVLNACTSLPVIRRFQNAVDYTVGMKRPITDESAIWFSAAFYGALAFGTTVEKAFEWGIARLLAEGSGEAATPRLRKRAGLHTPPPPLVEPTANAAPAVTSPSPTVSAAHEPRTTNTFNFNDQARVKNINNVNGDGTIIHG